MKMKNLVIHEMLRDICPECGFADEDSLLVVLECEGNTHTLCTRTCLHKFLDDYWNNNVARWSNELFQQQCKDARKYARRRKK